MQRHIYKNAYWNDCRQHIKAVLRASRGFRLLNNLWGFIWNIGRVYSSYNSNYSYVWRLWWFRSDSTNNKCRGNLEIRCCLLTLNMDKNDIAILSAKLKFCRYICNLNCVCRFLKTSSTQVTDFYTTILINPQSNSVFVIYCVEGWIVSWNLIITHWLSSEVRWTSCNLNWCCWRCYTNFKCFWNTTLRSFKWTYHLFREWWGYICWADWLAPGAALRSCISARATIAAIRCVRKLTNIWCWRCETSDAVTHSRYRRGCLSQSK